VMLQAAYNSIAERDQLKSWVMAKLLWDPRLDENELVQDFIWGYYGKAAPAIAEYDRLLVQAGKDHAKDLASPPGGIRYPMDVSFLSKDFLDQSSEIFARAKKLAADDPALLKKVERAELPILYVKLCRGPAFCGPTYASMIDQFDSVARREGATAMEEAGVGYNERVAAWRKLIPKPATAPAHTSYKVISPGPNSLSYQAFPDACRLKNGDIVCVFYAGYNHVSFASDDCPLGGRICMTRSSDEGKTWSTPQTLFDDADDNRDPHIAQLDDGSLICTFFSWHNKSPQRLKSSTDFTWPYFHANAKATGAQLVRSRDNGQTWETTPTAISPNWFCSAPVRTLKDGTCILGLYGPDPGTHHDRPGVVRSSDHFQTLESPVVIPTPAGVNLSAETDVIQLNDGSLYAALRGDKLPMHFSRSSDYGKTWTVAQPIGFDGHCPHLNRLSTGEIILSHRIPNTAIHISRDECKTWQGPYPIDFCIGAYPSTVELKDHTVLIVYYSEGPGSAIRANRFKVKPDGIEFLSL
jgi:sialidase-1